jgi:pilus assembly protein CpaF
MLEPSTRLEGLMLEPSTRLEGLMLEPSTRLEGGARRCGAHARDLTEPCARQKLSQPVAMPLFAIIISEKGGADRREAFDRPEITVGRVQGNDLMLAKGNVSKRHARLLHRDGRFIVTDLKSTNGTYVNGRKISQATIVREGDKIYIGDFVLRVEGASPASAQPGFVADDMSSGSAPLSRQDGPRHDAPRADARQEGHRPELSEPPPLAVPPPPPPVPRAPGVPMPPRLDRPHEPRPSDAVSHFPLEQDPDEAPPQYPVPGPPRVPSRQLMPVRPSAPPGPAPRGVTGSPSVAPPLDRFAGGHGATPSATPGPVAAIVPPAQPEPRSQPHSGPPTPAHAAPALGAFGAVAPAGGAPVAPQPTPSAPGSNGPSYSSGPYPSAGAPGAAQGAGSGPHTSSAPPTPSAPATPPSPGRRAGLVPERVERPDALRSAQHRAAVQQLTDGVEARLDLRALADGRAAEPSLVSAVEQHLAELARGLAPPDELELERLVAEARRELLELGPVGPLLDDEEVTEIQVVQHAYVLAMYGRRQVALDLAFGSEAAVARLVARLARLSGRPVEPDERFVERRLPRGARLYAMRPSEGGAGHLVVIRRPQRADQTLDDLVRAGTISRAMAGLLAAAVAGRANILVTGTHEAGAVTVLGALAAAGSTDDRVAALQEDDELVFNQPHTVPLSLGDSAEENARAVEIAVRMRADRVVVGTFAGAVAADLVDAIGDGMDGVLAAARCPTLRHAATRLPADLAATRPGLPVETAREWLAAAFDLVLEVGRLRDGRSRALRLGELAVERGQIVVRDVFVFTIERTAAGGALDGSFHATGVVPAVAEDLLARGLPVDSSSFRRHTPKA